MPTVFRRFPRAMLLVAVIVVLGVAWFALFRRPGDPGWKPANGPAPWFTDVGTAAGVTFRHTNGRTGQHKFVEIVGAGVALFDYDGDGWLDIYFVNGNHLAKAPDPDVTNVLYRNNRDGTFADVSTAAGVADAGYGQGCCAADYDNDGDVDLYVTNFGADRLYRNDGGRFTDVTGVSGIRNDSFGQCCAFFDFDNDGWLDLYVQNYVDYDYDAEKPRRDYDSPRSFRGAADRLFRNLGDGTFRDVTRAAGIHRPAGRGMGLVCADLDGDGDLDLFVANDAMENYHFVNKGDGTFVDDSSRSGLAYNVEGRVESSMGADVADFNGDGRLDILCAALENEGCTLYENRGATFEDVSYWNGLADQTREFTGFSPHFFDFDNDGDLDVFVTNGGVTSRVDVDADTEASYARRYGMPDVLLVNDGTGTFTAAGSAAGPYFRSEWIGRGAAVGDLDNDGDLDVVVANLGGPAVVLRNDAPPGNWIGLDLITKSGNRDAIGTRVRVITGGKSQTRVVRGTGGYVSLSDRRPHFGLADAGAVRIEIRWADGATQTLSDEPPNRYVTVRQQR